jgi:hypothetical protein
MADSNQHWLQLVISLPTNRATARMRIWRAIKALGCASLRDGVYLLPDEPKHRESLDELVQETRKEGGTAWLLRSSNCDPADAATYSGLFSRADEYGKWMGELTDARRTLASLSRQEAVKTQRQLSRVLEALESIDFFPSTEGQLAQAAWREFLDEIGAIISPDEPRAAVGAVRKLDARHYQGRRWATRKDIWVDRVACAWLIRRFIDRSSQFLWLSSTKDCPPDALGFDFDGATFTHVGRLVSFEVLMASFSLGDDPALQRLAAMVHSLDMEESPTTEARGFEFILSGARHRLGSDDQVMQEIGSVLDSLYSHFQREVTA